MNILPHGVYYISDSFFTDFPDPYLKGNKGERRPYYYCYKDASTGLLWMIPFTSQPTKLLDYQNRISSGRPVDIFHPTILDGRSGLLLIADMFPVVERYISQPYCISAVPVVYKDSSDIKAIDKKARKIIALLRKGIRFTKTQPDVFSIEKALLSELILL